MENSKNSLGVELMDVQDHHKEFLRIVKKYSLDKRADKISVFLTAEHGKKSSSVKFSKKFGMTNKEAVIFLAFIDAGLRWKEGNLQNV